jgi:hypothetical protein
MKGIRTTERGSRTNLTARQEKPLEEILIWMYEDSFKKETQIVYKYSVYVNKCLKMSKGGHKSKKEYNIEWTKGQKGGK